MTRALRGVPIKEAALAVALLAVLVAIKLIGSGGAPDADTYAVTDYRSGGYAAFFALMQREGVAVEAFERRPAELDGRIDTLIVAPPPNGIDQDVRTDADLAALRAWVRAGGRLVSLTASDAFAKPISKVERERKAATMPAPSQQPAVRAYGRGEIVTLAYPQRFSNAQIGNDGNARLAYELAKPLHAGGVVAFDEAIHGVVIDRPWWQAMTTDQRVALGGSALAIVIALAGGLLRLGPPVTVREVREPASDEFVAAAASLYERSHARRAALTLLAHGARNARNAAAMQLRELAEREELNDRDVLAGARLARIIREGN